MECVERRKTILGDINLFFLARLLINNTVTNGKIREFNIERDAENLPTFNIILHKRSF